MLIRALHSATTALPSDDQSDLIDLYEQRDVSADPVALDAIRAYVSDGDIQDFESARREYYRRLQARELWALEAPLASELNEAWEELVATPTVVRDLWSDEILSVALAVADAPLVGVRHKRSTILRMLATWLRRTVQRAA